MSSLLRDMMVKRKAGVPCGVASYCTANELVIEALLRQAIRFDDGILIEATANQVNQFGGYTGMQPADFRDFVYRIAERVGYPKERIVLGGDHLGPLTWASEPEEQAMAKAVELVQLFVRAGYQKIHLDTSMRLAGDPTPLSDRVIARRGVRLYQACEQAYQARKETDPSAERPVFIIGSEVPIPGGAQEQEEGVSVTTPEAAAQTLAVYREEFSRAGLGDAFENIIGIVVQPGVEFGDDDIFHYDHWNARSLCQELSKYEGVVMEGHSTDYQSPAELRQMVQDGIAILKVGPALTFALRNGLFALSRLEEALLPPEQRVNFEAVLEQTMLANPEKWQRYYRGTEMEVALKRKYSFSDRCRYYFAQPEITGAIQRLLDNINQVDLPLGLLYQYLPVQYAKVRDGVLKKEAKALLLDFVVEVAEIYNFATRYNYLPNSEYSA